MRKIYDDKQKVVRNQFNCNGAYDMPILYESPIELDHIAMISFDHLTRKRNNANKIVHFFQEDHTFLRVYELPEKQLSKIASCYAAITPDFSLYADMPRALQINSVFQSRWCGAYWQDNGIRVIPSVSWSTPDSFEFCFDGLPNEAIVVVSTIGCKKVRKEFMCGYDAMLERIKPRTIICCGETFPEMRGNILAFGYLEITGRRSA